MLNKTINWLENLYFKHKLKGLVKGASVNESIPSINLCWQEIDEKFFKDLDINHCNLLSISVNHKDMTHLLINIEQYLLLTKKQQNTYKHIETRYKTKTTLLDFLLTEEELVVDLLYALNSIKQNYNKITKFVTNTENEAAKSFYIRKLDAINQDLIQILTALAIYKKNT